MSANTLIQARIDAAVKKQAAVVLENMGLTVSDAVRMLLTRVAKEGALPAGLAVDPETHDAWFRSRVREALADTDETIAHEKVEAHFAKRHTAVKQRKSKGTT